MTRRFALNRLIYLFLFSTLPSLTFADGRYVEVLDSSKPPGFYQRIVNHEGSTFSARVGMRVHLELRTLLGEPVVYCPAVWWIEEIYDGSGSDLHKRPASQLPVHTLSEVDFYAAKLVVRLKTGQLLRCDPGVLDAAGSTRPSFTVPASPSWSKLLFWDEADAPRYVSASDAKNIWQDLIAKRQHSRHAVSQVALTEGSRINLWPLVRLREQALISKYATEKKRLVEEQAGAADIAAIERSLAEHANRFRQAFNQGSQTQSRFSRKQQLRATPCQHLAAESLTRLDEAARTGDQAIRCLTPNAPPSPEKAGPVKTRQLEQVAAITVSDAAYRNVKLLSSGVILQKYSDLYLHTRHGDVRRLDDNIANRARASYQNIIEDEDGGFLLYANGSHLNHYDSDGRKQGEWPLRTRHNAILYSQYPAGNHLIELTPAHNGNILAVYLSTSGPSSAPKFEIDLISQSGSQQLFSKQLPTNIGSPQISTEVDGPDSYCWVRTTLRAGEEYDYCLRYQAETYQLLPIDEGVRQAIELAEKTKRSHFAQRARLQRYPSWLNDESYGLHGNIHYHSSSEDDKHWVYLRGPQGENLSSLHFSPREKIKAVDSSGRCIATAARGNTFRFYCLK